MKYRPEEGWTTVLLVLAMIYVAAVAIVQTELTTGLNIIPTIAIAGLLAGFALAKSRLPANTAHLFALVYGLFALFLLVGSTLPEGMAWRERVFDIVNRQADWLQKAFEGGRSRDGLIFVIQTAAVYWLLGYTAAWYTFRTARVWRVVIPTGLVLLSVVYYYNGPAPLTLFLAVYAVLALVYIARTFLVEQERIWRAGRVRYEQEIWFNFLRASFMTALIALVAAWMMPTFTASAAVSNLLSGTRGPWREFQDTWTRLFSSLRAYPTNTNDPYLDTLTLSGARSVSNTPVMDVIVSKPLPYVYWQAVAYDSYRNGSWLMAADALPRLYEPESGLLNVPPSQAREVITHTVVNYLPNSSLIYGASELIGVDRPAFVEMSAYQGYALPTSLRSQYVLRLNDRYQVTARISTADAGMLRRAGTSYPVWVMERYLQLPDSISAETLALAQEIMAPYNTAFDKALATRDFLRAHIVYNDQIDAPPAGVDPVHYVLFDNPEGYCNYYAAAMVVMLRAQGIPSRVVSGYAQGIFDEDRLTYRVRASNAHTWVQVYFPGYGWIDFEPTAALPAQEFPLPDAEGNPGDAFGAERAQDRLNPEQELVPRDEEIEELPDFGQDAGAAVTSPLDEAEAAAPGWWQQLPLWQVGLGLALIVVAGLLLVVANLLNQQVERDVTRSYARLAMWARWLGILFRPAQTPYERAELLSTAVPEGRQPIQQLVAHYVTNQFSPRPQTDANTQEEWHVLRPLLLRKVWSRHWQRWSRLARRTINRI